MRPLLMRTPDRASLAAQRTRYGCLLAPRSSGHRGRARLGDGEADPEGAALPLDGLGADLAAHHVDHAAGDRQAEAEALLLARLAATVEALEDALDLRRRDAGSSVHDLQDDLSLAVVAAANGNGAGGWRVLEGVGEQADHHLAQQRRIAGGAEIGLDLDLQSDVRRRLDRGDDVADSHRHVDDLALRRAARLDPGQGQQRLGEAVHPLGVVGEPGEEVVAVAGLVLGAALEHLDRAGDPGQRVAQLVGGVEGEGGLGHIGAQLVGRVAKPRQHGVLVRQRAGGHRVGAVADPQRRVGGEADLRRPVELRQHHAWRLAGGGEQARGGAVGEANRAFEVDHHHRVGEAVEDSRQLVAVGGEDAEALLQRSAHRVEGAGEVADLVGAVDAERGVEGAARHLRRGAGQVHDAVGDRDRDQEAGEDADRHRGDQGLLVVAEEVDGGGGDRADRGEGGGEPEAHPDPRAGGARFAGHLVARTHEGLLTQNQSILQVGWPATAGPSGRIGRVRTLVFIPAWNEEASIAAVVADVREHLPGADILVVDDGSTDATTARARECGVLVATLPFNQGLGAALQTGYLYALREGYDCCAHLDADGQHPAAEVASLLAEVEADRADLVIGSRYRNPDSAAESGDYKPTFSRPIGTLAGIIAVAFMLLILELIRRDRLQERYSVIWFVAGLGMLAGAAFPGLLKLVADAMGVRDTNVALFSIVLLLLLGLALNFSVIMSRQAAQITRLAQERALEKARQQAEEEAQTPSR